MTFTLFLASDFDFKKSIMVNDLSDLEKLQKEYNYSLVINFERHTIIVYDDYLE